MCVKSKTRAWSARLCVALVGVIGASVTLSVSAQTPTTPPQAPSVRVAPPPARDEAPVMSPLERGVNRQGMDFSATAPQTENPAQCAEMCRTNAACKAMTYVISQKTCWLKKLVPPPGQPNGPDFVSSVKVYPAKQ
jgi:hypothetical protein